MDGVQSDDFEAFARCKPKLVSHEPHETDRQQIRFLIGPLLAGECLAYVQSMPGSLLPATFPGFRGRFQGCLCAPATAFKRL